MTYVDTDYDDDDDFSFHWGGGVGVGNCGGGITINIPIPKNIQQNFINDSTALDTFLPLLGSHPTDKCFPILRSQTKIQITYMNRFCS